MPEISRFLGMVVTMYYNDHSPPHFHVRYGRQKALIALETLTLLEGELSPRALSLVLEWASLHDQALKENWELATRHLPLVPIPPLE
jgi:hypothetical protein